MIKVMIVDDERYIRQGLRILIDWNKYGYEIAAEAGNGLEALEIFAVQPVDLMIVDLNMPGMSGLELIEDIRRTADTHVRFLILTGHAEFEYAQTAIALGVDGYILKPVQAEELIPMLERMNVQHREACLQKERERHAKRLEFMRHAANLLMNKFIRDDVLYLREHLLSASSWRYVSFEFDGSDSRFAELEQSEKVELEYECVRSLEELVVRNPAHVMPAAEKEEDLYGACLLYCDQLCGCEERSSGQYLGYLHNKLSEQHPYPVRIYIGSEVDSLEKLGESFRSVHIIRCLHNLGGRQKKIISDEELKKSGRISGIRRQDVEELMQLVKENHQEKMGSCIERIYRQISHNALSLDLARANIYYLFHGFLELARELDDEMDQMEVLQYLTRESFDKIMLGGNPQELVLFVRSFADYLDQLRQKSSRDILDRVEEYIREHYAESLSLKHLGEIFFINNVYLGQLFKKKYGVSFKEYLNDLRICEGAKLLENSDLRVYAVAKKVGFANPDYFINKFVQMKGSTPHQYRMNHKRK